MDVETARLEDDEATASIPKKDMLIGWRLGVHRSMAQWVGNLFQHLLFRGMVDSDAYRAVAQRVRHQDSRRTARAIALVFGSDTFGGMDTLDS